MSSQTTTCWWTFAITSLALFMVTLDNLVVTTALPVIRARPALRALAARVDGQRLHADLRRAAPHRRGARRPLRPAADVLDRARDLHARLGGGCARTVDRRARRRARGAGPRRRDRDAAHADDPLGRRAGGAPRRLALGAWGGISGLAVAFGPLVGGAVVVGHLVALDLLAERADRARARCRSRCSGSRSRRARSAARPAAGSCSRAPGCSGSSGASSAATPSAGARPRSSARSSPARS